MNAITIIPEVGLTEIESEPRVRDIDLADRLGFRRPRDIRKLIERNMAEISRFGTCATVAHVVKGNAVSEYWLNEEQGLLVAALSNADRAAEVRHMLIRVFVAYRRGHLIESPVAVLDEKTKNAIGGIVKSCTSVVLREQLATVLPTMLDAMVAAKLAERSYMLRRGKTAGEIWHDHNFPRIRVTCWFSNRLVQMGCQIEGGGRGELGLGTAKLFDPDKAENWLKNGGRKLVEEYIVQRQGQGRLRLVGGRA